MIPKKTNKLYKQFAEEQNVSETLVEDLIDFFYKTLKDELTGLKHLRVNVPGLGHFVAKPSKIEKGIEKYSKVLQNHDTSTFSAYHNKKTIENKLELLHALKEKLQEQEDLKIQKQNQKNEFTNKHMEE